MASLLDPHPTLLVFGHYTLYTHGIFFAMGALLGTLVLYFLTRRRNLPFSSVPETVLWIFISGLLASRVGYIILYPKEFSSLSQMAALWNGGLVSYFGIAAGLAVSAFLLRKFPKDQRLILFDCIAVAALFAWSVGRIGNYYAADSFGMESPAFSLFYGRVPIQLFESLFCLVAGIILFAWIWTGTSKRFAGLVLPLTLSSYGLVRTIIDFWRDEPATAVFLKPSQIGSLLLVIVGISWLSALLPFGKSQSK